MRIASVLVCLSIVMIAADPPKDEPQKEGSGFIGATVRVHVNENGQVLGVLIVDLIKDGPAHKAGLVDGDIIFKVDNKPIQDLNTFRDVIRGHKPGDEVIVHFLRDKKEGEFRVVLGKRPDM